MDHPPFLADETPEERYLRANTYALLAHLLAGVPGAELRQLIAALPATAENDTPLDHAWADLALATRGADGEILRAEYQTVFIGVTRGEVLPYASWYRTGFLMEKPLADLRADLTHLGYVRQPGVHEPEDHAAALCEVMAQLASAADSRQVEFFQVHMVPWLSKFFQDVQTAHSAVFYRPVGALGMAFMAFEEGYMGVAQGPTKHP